MSKSAPTSKSYDYSSYSKFGVPEKSAPIEQQSCMDLSARHGKKPEEKMERKQSSDSDDVIFIG